MTLLSYLERCFLRQPKKSVGKQRVSRRARPNLEALESRALPSASPIVIDSFGTNQSALTLTFPPAGTSAASSASGTGIVGGERDLQINLTSGVIAGNTISSTVSSGFLSYSQDATITGSAVLQWDGTDGSSTLNATGLGGIDLTAGGSQDAFALAVSFDDLPVSVVITVYTDAGNASSTTLPLPGLIFSMNNYVVPYSAFSPTLGAGADFSNVGAITLSVGSSTTAPDLVIDSLQTTSLVKATQTVVLLNDANSNGQANAGDTLRYTVTLTNPADAFAASATGSVFSNPAPANTTLVVGSVTTTQGSVTSGNSGGDSSVAVNIGTIVDGGTVTITFDVTIQSPLPGSVTQISSQGTVTTDTISALLTDDPTSPGLEDPTTQAVVGNNAPVLGGAVANQAANDNATVAPFTALTIADTDSPAQTLTVEVQLSSTANGRFTAASLTASGFTNQGGGLYRYAGTAAQAQAAIRQLVFDPTENQVAPGGRVTTVFTVSVNDGSAPAVRSSTTSVVVTSVNDRPTGQASRYTVGQNTTLVVAGPGVLRGARNADVGQRLRARLYRKPAVGTLTLNADGSFRYTPPRSFRGRVTFQFRVFDGLSYSQVITVAIDVLGPRLDRRWN